MPDTLNKKPLIKVRERETERQREREREREDMKCRGGECDKGRKGLLNNSIKTVVYTVTFNN